MTATLLHDLLDERAALTPDADAVRDRRHRWTYRELARRSVVLARWLRGRGVHPGDRVLVLAPHDARTAALVYACSRVGALHVVLSDQVLPYHLEHILDDCAPSVVIAVEGAVQRLSAAGVAAHTPAELPDDEPGEALPDRPPCLSIDPVALIYTSGSTAMPKAVVSTHSQVIFAASAIQERLRYRPDDVVLCCPPLSFDYGLYQVFLAALSGACLVLGDSAAAGPALTSHLVEHRVSVLPLVPSLATALVRLLTRAGTPPPRLRLVTNTGAALHATAAEALRQVVPGLDVVAMFGLTECKRVSIAEPNSDLLRPGAAGRPLRDTEAYAVDDDGTRLPPGEIGELVVRGRHVMAGYWRAPELTARRFRRDEFGRPVLHTGDRCRFDAEGNLYFAGRDDDVYKQRGFRMSTVELEAAALDVPGVELAAALPPEDGGDARLVATGEVSVRRLTEELAVRLEPHKLPGQCLVVPELPLGPNGKVDKKALARVLGGAR